MNKKIIKKLGLKPQEQQYTYSCLLVALAILAGIKMTKKQEGELLLAGLEKHYLGYHQGMFTEFLKKYPIKLNLLVEYKPYAKYLQKYFSHNKYLLVDQAGATLVTMKKLITQSPLIVYLDSKFLEYPNYADHAGHFIVVESFHDNQVTILDPWDGLRRDIKVSSLLECIESLKKQFKYSPLIITLR